MNYKECKYYKKCEEQGHCPFSKTCKDDCFFSLMELKDSFDELNRDMKELENENHKLEDELEDMKSFEEENWCLENENHKLEDELEDMKSFEEENWRLENERDDLQDELDNLKEKHAKLEKKFIKVVNFCKELINDLEKYEGHSKFVIDVEVIEHEE